MNSPSSNPSVLVVEDDPIDAEFLLRLFARSPGLVSRADTACSLGRAIEQLKFTSYELIMLDLSLPDSEGLHTVRQISDASPNSILIVLTGFPDEDLAQEALGLGAADYLFKDELNEGSVRRSLLYALQRKATETILYQKEQQLQHALRLEAIGRLAGGVAHDFNNLLTVVNGFVHLAIEQLGGAHPVSQDLDQVSRAVRRGSHLVEQLLDFSRRRAPNPEPISIAETIRETQLLLGRSLGDGIALEIRLPEDLPPVTCGRGQLQQLLINLAFNARDALGGKGRVSLSATHSNDRGLVRLTVADDGPGIPEEHLEKIFEAFFSTKGELGTGLGLATSAAIMESLGGAISVDSAPGKGARFHLDFPVQAARATAPLASPPQATPEARGETVLLVEDEPQVRLFAQRVLTRAGYRVEIADHGAQALKRLETVSELPALALIDLGLPGMTGSDLASQLQARFPHLPLLITSGEAYGAQEAVGPIRFLPKPFSPDQLVRTIHDLLHPADS